MNESGVWTDAELARLRLEGLDHLNRLRSGEATDEDAAAFLTWRHHSPAHEAALRSAIRLQQLVRVVETEDWAVSQDNVVPFHTPPRPVSRRLFLGGAIAASVAGGVFVAGRSLDMVAAPEEMLADYRTGPGERRIVRFASGASAELNTRTSIEMRGDLGMPAVELINGEAMLTSSQGAAAAIVAGKGTSIVRMGRVNARLDGGAVCITCLAGQAQVKWAGQDRLLHEAEELRYNQRSIGRITKAADIAALSAWRSGTLIFRNMPMRQVVAEINRYRPGRVFLTNERLADRSLSGTYFVDRLDDFFRQAELAFGVEVTRLPGNVVLLG